MGILFSTYAPLALFVGYLLGSIPFGLLLTRWAGLGDVRNIGSGNIGATNVLRTGNKGLAALTLILDMLKGTAAAVIASRWGAELGMIAGFTAFLGHLFPVWLGFKGGKGVATYIGVLIGLHWPAAVVFCLVWIGAALAWRYSSLAALAGTVAVVLYYLLLGQAGLLFILIMSILVFGKHHGNIRRLIAGEETKIGARSSARPAGPAAEA